VVSLSNSGEIVDIPGDLGVHVVINKVPKNAFWAEAMHHSSALFNAENSFTHVLWLNEDVTLAQNSIDNLLNVMTSTNADIVVGQTCSEDGKLTYGGFLRNSVIKPLHFRRVIANDAPLEIETFNGNIVLIGPEALIRIGPFLPGYKHYLADIAYGLNAAGKRLKIMLAPGFSGVCQANDFVNPSLDKRVSRKKRLATLNSPQGLPFIQQLKFSLQYGRGFGIFYFSATYLRFLMTLAIYEKSKPESL
jgi:GT2 family glycosyltransferase